MMSFKYQKIDMSNVDRKKIEQAHGINTNEKIKIYDETKHVKELWAYPCVDYTTTIACHSGELRCYWDHHSFEGTGIFCPLSHRPRQVAKTNTRLVPNSRDDNTTMVDDDTPCDMTDADKPSSNCEEKQRRTIVKGHVENVFVIKENIPTFKDVSALNVVELTKSYYEVDGLFCSVECCLAFINNEKTKVGGSIYSESEKLLYSMLKLTTKIMPANSFRLLRAYGGNLTIEQFRQNNKSIKYEYNGTTVLISHLFEKKINL
jgi:hypothetical protein